MAELLYFKITKIYIFMKTISHRKMENSSLVKVFSTKIISK